MANQTTYNGEEVLDGTRSGSFQVGTTATSIITFDIDSVTASAIGVDGVTCPLHQVRKLH